MVLAPPKVVPPPPPVVTIPPLPPNTGGNVEVELQTPGGKPLPPPPGITVIVPPPVIPVASPPPPQQTAQPPAPTQQTAPTAGAQPATGAGGQPSGDDESIPPGYVPGETQLLADEDGPTDDERELAYVGNPGGEDFVTRLRTYSQKYRIDPLAAGANALYEGLDGQVGDDGRAYGPWQIHLQDGRLKSFRGGPANDHGTNVWAWSDAGTDYAFRSMVAAGAAGLTGHPAVRRICLYFEKPANPTGELGLREDAYDNMKGMGDNAYVLLDNAAAGPVGGNVPSGVGKVQPKPSVGAQTQWSNLLHYFKTTAPQQKANAIAAADIEGAIGQ